MCRNNNNNNNHKKSHQRPTDGDVTQEEGFRKEAHQFYSSVLWLHPGPVNPVSHPHQIMHTHAPKETNIRTQRKKKTKQKTNKLTNVKCSGLDKPPHSGLFECNFTDIGLEAVTDDAGHASARVTSWVDGDDGA